MTDYRRAINRPLSGTTPLLAAAAPSATYIQTTPVALPTKPSETRGIRLTMLQSREIFLAIRRGWMSLNTYFERRRMQRAQSVASLVIPAQARISFARNRPRFKRSPPSRG